MDVFSLCSAAPAAKPPAEAPLPQAAPPAEPPPDAPSDIVREVSLRSNEPLGQDAYTSFGAAQEATMRQWIADELAKQAQETEAKGGEIQKAQATEAKDSAAPELGKDAYDSFGAANEARIKALIAAEVAIQKEAPATEAKGSVTQEAKDGNVTPLGKDAYDSFGAANEANITPLGKDAYDSFGVDNEAKLKAWIAAEVVNQKQAQATEVKGSEADVKASEDPCSDDASLGKDAYHRFGKSNEAVFKARALAEQAEAENGNQAAAPSATAPTAAAPEATAAEVAASAAAATAAAGAAAAAPEVATSAAAATAAVVAEAAVAAAAAPEAVAPEAAALEAAAPSPADSMAEGSLIEVYSASAGCWCMARITAAKTSQELGEVLTVFFWAKGVLKQKNVRRGDSQLAPFRTNTDQEALPPGFQKAIPDSILEAGTTIAFADATTGIKYARPELAWNIFFDRLINPPQQETPPSGQAPPPPAPSASEMQSEEPAAAVASRELLSPQNAAMPYGADGKVELPSFYPAVYQAAFSVPPPTATKQKEWGEDPFSEYRHTGEMAAPEEEPLAAR